MRLVAAAALLFAPLAAASVGPAETTAAAQRSAQQRPSTTTGRAAPRTESPVPFRVGETLTYDVSWSSFIVAGTAVSTVKEKKPSKDSTAYYVVVEGRPVPLVARLYTLYYKMDSLIDAYGLLSQKGTFYAEEGSDRRTTTTAFDRAGRKATFEQKTDTVVTAAIPIPAQAQDGLAAFYSLRGRSLKAGERITIPVADSGALYTTQVDVGAAPENVNVPIGQVSAWKLKIAITDAANQPVWKDIALWMSNDARRLPVKMQAELPVGAFVLTLKDAK